MEDKEFPDFPNQINNDKLANNPELNQPELNQPEIIFIPGGYTPPKRNPLNNLNEKNIKKSSGTNNNPRLVSPDNNANIEKIFLVFIISDKLDTARNNVPNTNPNWTAIVTHAISLLENPISEDRL